MANTELLDVNAQVKMFWADVFMPELRESNPFIALVDKRYEGAIAKAGDTVRVSQIAKATGELKTIGTAGDNTFTPEKIVTQYVDIKADKRAIASYKMEDLVELQSQITSEKSEIRQSLLDAISTQINGHLYAQVAPIAGHVLTGVSAFDNSVMKQARVLAGKAKWLKSPAWYCCLTSGYYGDLMDGMMQVSSDVVNDQPTIGGEIVSKRYGFSVLEDNSQGLEDVAPLGDEAGVLFHPAFMHLVTQQAPRFKVSDLHSNEEFGYLISVDVVFGCKQSIEGAKQVITVINT